MIDLHSHILPGLDDGAETLDAAVEMARAAVEDGIEVLAATPHVSSDYPTSAEEMEREVRAVREAVAAAGVPLEVLPGGEIALDRLHELDPEELPRFGLGGNPRLLLLEFPYLGWPLALTQTLFDLRLRGFRVLLAHPERNADVQVRPEALADALQAGAFVQVTAASLDGRLGRAPRAVAMRLLELGFVHVLASDAHAPSVRQIGMRAAAEAVGDDELARWLTRDVPRALVDGVEPPARPERASRRRRFPWTRN